MPFNTEDPNVQLTTDERGVVRHIEHFQKPYLADSSSLDAVEPSARELATQYLREVAPVYGINPETISDTEQGLTDSLQPEEGGQKIQIAEEKSAVPGTTTLSYQQTYSGLPVWESGLRVVVQEGPQMRVTSSDSTVHLDLQLEETGLADSEDAYTPDKLSVNGFQQLLGSPNLTVSKITRMSMLIYRYEPENRFDPERNIQDGTEHERCPPALPLPPVPEQIRPGYHYVVTEVLFTLALENWGDLNWRAFVETQTGAILYLRAFVSCATGLIFRFDPITITGNPIYPSATDAELDGLRVRVELPGLSLPAPNDPQALEGEFVRLLDIGAPAISPPREPLPGDFSYQARTDNFAAVNAYYHCDWLFRTMQELGFDVPRYFDGTAFPVPVDHRDLGGAVNARAPGNALGNGSDGFRFALAASGQPVGIASDIRVVLHEFGHALLWDNVHSANFGFAHSAGDSLAAILCDPESRAFDMDETFPWIRLGRRHDRAVDKGWAWGGVNDKRGYLSEQILSTTLVRFYRSIGGSDPHINVKRFSSRYTAYLIIRAIGSLGSGTITPTPIPDTFATALINADIGTANFKGHPGGAFNKVVRWSFEKQGLYQLEGTPGPIVTEGAPPAVDVYIDDGRGGGYEYREDFWNATEIWNRVAADGGTEHQPPATGATNYAYVRVRNRGIQPAADVVVRGYQSRPAVGLVWPDDWQPMTTPQLPVPNAIAPKGEIVVGPFEWTPQASGNHCLLMSASATGDLSNIDPASMLPCAVGPIPEWRLVPFDNNLARRNVTAALAGGGGADGLIETFKGIQFRVKNPFDRDVEVELRASVPEFLVTRGWELRFENPGGAAFTLGAGKSRDVAVSLVKGEDFDAAAVGSAPEKPRIEIRALIDGSTAGGVSYVIDPNQGGGGDQLLSDEAQKGTDAVKSLLAYFNLPADEVKSVKLKRISVEIDL